MKRRARRGFTLIEAIGAIVILSVAVPALLMATREAQGGRASAALACRARWLAGEKLEEIVADRNSDTRGYAYLVGAHYPSEAAVDGFAGFARSVSIEQTTADLTTPGAGHAVVTVAVTWMDGRGAPRSLTLSTVVADYAP